MRTKSVELPNFMSLVSRLPYYATSITLLLTAAVVSNFEEARAQTPDYAVTQGWGDYEYDGGGYRASSMVIDGAMDTVTFAGDTVAAAEGFFNSVSSVGLWRTSNYGGMMASAGLGLQLGGPFLNGAGIYPAQRGPYLGVKAGPFYIDNIMAGVGGMYSDYQGSPLVGSLPAVRGDDNWAAVIWASARITAFVTDRFALSIQPSIYYLPLKGEVGWGIAAPFYNMFSGQMGPTALLQFAYRLPLEGSFEVALWDDFRMINSSGNLLTESPYFGGNFMDATPVDYAGRYYFGVGSRQEIDATGRGDFRFNDDFFSSDRFFYSNTGGINIRGRHGPSVRSAAYYTRYDVWDSGFDAHTAWNTAGAMILNEGPVFTPYAFYEVNAMDDYDTVYHQVVVGTNARLNPNLIAYAQAGWLWSERAGMETEDTWVALAGFRHRLGPYTFHGLDVGRSPMGSFGTRFLSDFVRYYVQHQVGPQAIVRVYAEQADMHTLGGPGSTDRSVTTVAATAEFALSNRSAVGLFASYENVDMPQVGRGFELWTYRAYYNRQLGPTVQGQIFYQYQESGSGVSNLDHFTEHLLFVGVIKHF